MNEKTIDDGGPAFPCLPMQDGRSGMTLREYYAGQAMAGDWASQNEQGGFFSKSTTFKGRAALWLRSADALIAALKVEP